MKLLNWNGTITCWTVAVDSSKLSLIPCCLVSRLPKWLDLNGIDLLFVFTRLGNGTRERWKIFGRPFKWRWPNTKRDVYWSWPFLWIHVNRHWICYVIIVIFLHWSNDQERSGWAVSCERCGCHPSSVFIDSLLWKIHSSISFRINRLIYLLRFKISWFKNTKIEAKISETRISFTLKINVT